MRFCPKSWHLVRQGSTLAEQHQEPVQWTLPRSLAVSCDCHWECLGGLNTDQPVWLKRWVCLMKVFVEETAKQRKGGGMLLSIWQTIYTVINISSLFFRRKKKIPALF